MPDPRSYLLSGGDIGAVIAGDAADCVFKSLSFTTLQFWKHKITIGFTISIIK